MPKSPKVLQEGTQKSSKIVKKSHQNGTLGQGKEIIPILLFGDHFWGSFWEPFGSHFCTCGLDLTTKRCLKNSLLFEAVFCCFFDHFWRGRTRVSYGIYQSKHVFDLLGKVAFFVVFDLVLAPVFDRISAKPEPKAFERTPLKTPRKKTPKKTAK